MFGFWCSFAIVFVLINAIRTAAGRENGGDTAYTVQYIPTTLIAAGVVVYNDNIVK